MSINGFQILSKLGKGAYSSIYKVKRLVDNQIYALKLVKLSNLSEKQKQNALNQAIILASISHPNIIGYREAFLTQDSQSLCIIMQYAEQGDLLTKIKNYKQSGKTFNEDQIWKIILSILNGIRKLHDMKIIHRDLKNANIFITKNQQIKIGDLNVSKLSYDGLCRTRTGTPFYASPEIWKDQPYNSKSDIWSLGCMFYELATLKPPFNGEDLKALFKSVTRGIYPKIPTYYSTDLSDLIRMMLQTNSNIRPTSEKLINCSIMKKRMMNFSGELGVNQNLQIEIKPLLVDKSLFRKNNFKLITENLPEPNYIRQRVKTEHEVNIIKTQKNQIFQPSSVNRVRLNSFERNSLISPQRTVKLINQSERSTHLNLEKNPFIYKISSKAINIVKEARKQVNSLNKNNQDQININSEMISSIMTRQNERNQRIRSRLKSMKNQITRIKKIQRRHDHINFSQYEGLLQQIKQIKSSKQ